MRRAHTSLPVLSLLVLLDGAVLADVEIKPEFEFEHAHYDQARLSPDGQYIAVVTTIPAEPDARNLVTMRLSDNSAKAITGFSDTDVGSFFWVNDKRLVFSTDKDADENGAVRVYRDSYTIIRDGSGGRKVYQPRVNRRAAGQSGVGTAPQLLHRMPTDWNKVLISLTSSLTVLPEGYLLNVETGRTRRVVANEFQITQWYADHIGNVRAAVDTGADVLDGLERLLYRDSPESDWREVISYKQRDLSVLAFHADNRRLIVLARVDPGSSDNRRGLYLMSPDGKLVKALLFDEVYDVGNLSGGAVGLKQTAQGRVVYYQYMADSLRTVYFDPRWKTRQEIIDEALADTVNTIVDWSDDERQVLIFARLDTDAGDYYLFDTTYHELKFLPPPANWLKDQR